MNRLIIELMDAWLLSSKDTRVWWANMPLTFDAKSRLNTAALRPVGYALFNNTRHYASMYIHWKREQKGVKSLNGLFSCITQRGRVIQRRNRDVGIYVFWTLQPLVGDDDTAQSPPGSKSHSNTYMHVQPTPGLKTGEGWREKTEKERVMEDEMPLGYSSMD